MQALPLSRPLSFSFAPAQCPVHNILTNQIRCRCSSTQHLRCCQAAAQRRQLWCQAAGKGFADKGSVKSKGKRERENWNQVAQVAEFPEGKSVWPITLPSKSIVMLYRYGGSYFCSAPNSTAFQFPLADAKVFERDGKAAVEVPFDGTVYDLQTGKVLVWCPKNNPIRWVLGSLKEKASPEPLQVFPVQEEDGVIYVRFS